MLLVATVAVVATLPAGCGGSEPQTQAAAVPVKYADINELLRDYNAVATRVPLNPSGILPFMHVENDRQRQMLEMMRIAAPVMELEAAMLDRFKEGIIPGSLLYPEGLHPDQPATLRSNDGQRAEADFVDGDGATRTLHMVRIGERWWVSGYTLEYSPGAAKLTAEKMELTNDVLMLISGVAEQIGPRVRGGEFNTIASARTAIADALFEHAGDGSLSDPKQRVAVLLISTQIDSEVGKRHASARR